MRDEEKDLGDGGKSAEKGRTRKRDQEQESEDEGENRVESDDKDEYLA